MPNKRGSRAREHRARLDLITAVLLLAAAVVSTVVAVLQLSHSW
jgi:hypothetical protein